MDLTEFAQKLGISERILLNYTKNASKHYREYWSPPNKRLIYSPNKNLKTIQRFIIDEFLTESFFDCVHGYVKGRSIITNAQMHVDNRYVLVMDIENFFSSIKKSHVAEIFSKLHCHKISTELAELCTYKGFLPQGAPSSPVLSNYFFRSYDEEILKVCNRFGVVYTRYADDLTFSSNSIDDLTEIKKEVGLIVNKNEILKENTKKTRIMRGKMPILVTGINIQNSVLQVQKKQKKLLRAMTFNKIVNNDPISWKRISGLYNFIISVEPDFKEHYLSYFKKIKQNKALIQKQTF